MKKYLIIAGAVAVLAAGGAWLYWQANSQSNGQQQATTPLPVDSFDRTQYSTDTPGSLWWIVNKSRELPDNYMPPDLKAPNIKLRWAAIAESMQVSGKVVPSLEAMYKAMVDEGFDVYLVSGFRSEQTQADLYNRYVRQSGQEYADKISARPGTSEHQTGLAVDIGRTDKQCELEECFGELPEGKWLAEHAHEYGFIIRYPKGKGVFTGYDYEPWHLRYVGKELAAELYSSQSTMEEFFAH